jgi:uncharacterized RDD family membrane protein YckC
MASVSRRVVALFLDWGACLLIAHSAGVATAAEPPLTLAVFFAEVSLLTALTGSSFGQRVVGIRVAAVGGERLSVPRCVLRTALVCLVIPALVWDRDGRGLHDILVGSTVVRR